MCRNSEQQTTSKGETLSRGLNKRLPSAVNVMLTSLLDSLKGLCYNDIAVLGQFCSEDIT